jgi:hypothetical protein
VYQQVSSRQYAEREILEYQQVSSRRHAEGEVVVYQQVSSRRYVRSQHTSSGDMSGASIRRLAICQEPAYVVWRYVRSQHTSSGDMSGASIRRLAICQEPAYVVWRYVRSQHTSSGDMSGASIRRHIAYAGCQHTSTYRLCWLLTYRQECINKYLVGDMQSASY